MNRYLIPRLHRSPAASIWEMRANESLTELHAGAATHNELQVLAPTGGTPIPAAELTRMAEEIRSRAIAAGYPEFEKREYRKFDVWAATWFADNWPGYIGEALRPDTWAFLSTVLLPDIVVWRWPNRTPERLYGPLARNALGRLWLHGSLLNRDEGSDWSERWELLRFASEDFLMNLVERTSLSADKNFAVAVAEEWLRWRTQVKSGDLERLNRAALKRLRLLTTTVDPAVLDAKQRKDVIAEAFIRSFEAINSAQ